MKLYSVLLLAFFLTLAADARAALVSVKASADMTSGLPLATDLLPIGTTVSSDLILDIGAGTHETAVIDNVSGSFDWVDASLGAQSFTATDARISTRHSDGWFVFLFTGNGPTIDGVTAMNFRVRFDVGTNPFRPPGSTAELYDLILNSSISEFRVSATKDRTVQAGVLETGVTAAISPVPLPGAAFLFASALLGLGAAGRTRGGPGARAARAARLARA